MMIAFLSNKKLAFFIWNLYRFSLFWFYISDLFCSSVDCVCFGWIWSV